MQKTERELTDVEMIDALLEIIDLIIATYDNPIRDEFKRTSRCSQAGYDIIMLLISKGMIRMGKRNAQMSINDVKEETNG